MDELALEQIFCDFFGFILVVFIPPLHYTHLSLFRDLCNSPNQATHYYTLGNKVGASGLIRHLSDFRVKTV
jgi:hypothetical protein